MAARLRRYSVALSANPNFPGYNSPTNNYCRRFYKMGFQRKLRSITLLIWVLPFAKDCLKNITRKTNTLFLESEVLLNLLNYLPGCMQHKHHFSCTCIWSSWHTARQLWVVYSMVYEPIR